MDNKNKNGYGRNKYLKGYDEIKFREYMEKVKKSKSWFFVFHHDLEQLQSHIGILIDMGDLHIEDRRIDLGHKDVYLFMLSLCIVDLINMFINKFNQNIVALGETRTKEYYDSFAPIFAFKGNREKHNYGNMHEYIKGNEHIKNCANKFEKLFEEPKDFSQFFGLLDQGRDIKNITALEQQYKNIGNYPFATGPRPIAKTIPEFIKKGKQIPTYCNYMKLLGELKDYGVKADITNKMIGFVKKLSIFEIQTFLKLIGTDFIGQTSETMRKLIKLDKLLEQDFESIK